MTQIKVSTFFPHQPIERQIPPGLTSMVFHCNDGVEVCGAWIVLTDLDQRQTSTVDGGPVILVVMEPKEYCRYSVGFLDQFDLVVSSFHVQHRRCLVSRDICLPWHAGLQKGGTGSDVVPIHRSRTFQDLRDIARPKKTKSISAIISTNQNIPGHSARTAFLDRLKLELGDELDIFGWGRKPLSDKLEGVLPYRYHLALENSVSENYWSEKLPDALIGYSYPFYYGNAPVEHMCSGPFYCRLNIRDIPTSVEAVKRKMYQGLSDIELTAMYGAREAVFQRFHLFAFLAQTILRFNSSAVRQRRTITLFPQSYFQDSDLSCCYQSDITSAT